MAGKENPRGFKSGVLKPLLKYPYRLLTESSFRRLNWYDFLISRKPRFEPGRVGYKGGKEIQYCDAASFLSAFDGIFVGGIYDIGEVTDPPYFVDAGANIGLAVLYWMERYPNCTGIAFEPDPEVRATLETNLDSWGASFEVKPYALASEEGEIEFAQQGGDAGRIAGLPFDSPKGNVTVKTDRLSKYLDREVDLLKIDIEGAEFDVLVECKDQLRNVRRIFVESHSFVGKPQDYGELIALLQAQGFRCHIDLEGSSWSGFLHTGSKRDMELNFEIFGIREDCIPTEVLKTVP